MLQIVHWPGKKKQTHLIFLLHDQHKPEGSSANTYIPHCWHSHGQFMSRCAVYHAWLVTVWKLQKQSYPIICYCCDPIFTAYHTCRTWDAWPLLITACRDTAWMERIWANFVPRKDQCKCTAGEWKCGDYQFLEKSL